MTLQLNMYEMAMSVMARSQDVRDSGRESRFMDLTRHHGALIAKVCFYYSGTIADFDDLRQDCLVNLWRGLDSFDGRSSLSTWVYRVCLNTCVSTLRKVSRQPEKVSLELAGEVAGADDSERREQLECMYRMISQLPLIERGIVMMWLDGCTYDEIADTVGVKRNTVAVRLHRIKHKLSNTYSL